jgi:hypothetical protein
VKVREDAVIGHVDRRLVREFAPQRVAETEAEKAGYAFVMRRPEPRPCMTEVLGVVQGETESPGFGGSLMDVLRIWATSSGDASRRVGQPKPLVPQRNCRSSSSLSDIRSSSDKPHIQAVFPWFHLEDPLLLLSDLAHGLVVEKHRVARMRSKEAKKQTGREHSRGRHRPVLLRPEDSDC